MDALLLIKIITVPLLLWSIAELSWRSGNLAAAVLAGLPCISGPISLFITIDQGTQFGQKTLLSGLPGICACVLFGVVFARASTRFRLPGALAISLSAYFIAAWLCCLSAQVVWPWFFLSLAAPITGVALLPEKKPEYGPERLAKVHKIPLMQMFVGGVVTVLLTLGAQTLGPEWSGVLLFYPVICSVVASFALVNVGPNAVISLFDGAFKGLSGAGIFIGLTGILVTEVPVALAYVLGLTGSLAFTSAIVLISERRRQKRASQG